MATTKPNKIGRIRERLAEMITEAIKCKVPGAYALPEDLNSNEPWCATVQADGVSWDGYIHISGMLNMHHVYSYDTMSILVRNGFEMVNGADKHDWELLRKDEPISRGKLRKKSV